MKAVGCPRHKRRRQQSRKNMEEGCPKSHHLYLRIRNELSLTADWALGKQGGGASKPKGPLEALRPKLQPTQQNARARRSSYASADNDESLSLPADELIRKDVPAEDKNQQ
ncbi:hypothetical protein ACQ4PT_046406 [Festuca glaucescens]